MLCGFLCALFCYFGFCCWGVLGGFLFVVLFGSLGLVGFVLFFLGCLVVWGFVFAGWLVAVGWGGGSDVVVLYAFGVGLCGLLFCFGLLGCLGVGWLFRFWVFG